MASLGKGDGYFTISVHVKYGIGKIREGTIE
jgi:hypothetical protein